MRKKRAAGSPVPWRKWNLDKAFFNELSRYSTDHTETSLSSVLHKVTTGLEAKKDLPLLIPNYPFPARDFIQALAHLVKLGMAISRAKTSVQLFASQVVNWVLDIKSAFEASDTNRFTWNTWRNLAKMRDLVDEICTWAVSRLNDKRWARIGNGMKIGSEISEFNSRIADAKELFKDLSIIDLSSGIGGIYNGIKLLLKRQDTISREIKKVKESQLGQLTSIVDEMEAQKQAEQRRHFFAQTLLPRTVMNPTYDQQGKNPCDVDTRIEVLAEIMQWIHDISPQSPNFLWLTGDPGCGKSAITASIARNCKDDGNLWAQFFINRNNVETTDPNTYFPSIACQLLDHSLDVERAIYATLKRKPSLMDSISPDQAVKLFLDAIGVASQLNPRRPVVIVIDALDETDRSRLKETAIIFSHLFRGLSAYPNAKVFLSSRTEDDVRNPFARHMKDKHVKHIHLDTAAQSSIDDVTTFLRRKVVEIVEENDLNWTVWPGEKRMATLATRAAGLFIWAVTVTKFLQEQIDTLGAECLDDVLDIINAEDLSDLNTLYNIILRQTYKHEADNKWECEKFRRIIGAIVMLREPLNLRDLRQLLEIRQTASNTHVDIGNFVRRLRTVLVAGTSTINDETVPRLHKSFYEFITSQQVPTHFRIDPKTSDAELASRCLRQLSLVQHNIATLQSSSEGIRDALPGHLRYAIRFWSSHLHQAKGTSSGMILRKTRPRALGLNQLLRVYAQPSGSGSSEPLNIALSSDRSQITITTSDDWRVWDACSGEQRSRVFHGHTNVVTSVAFSPDGERLISGSLDKTLIMWDTATVQPIGPPLEGHSAAVYSVAFSPTGNCIASGSEDHSVRVWSVPEMCLIATLTGHMGPVQSVAFSSEGDEILSGSEDHTLRRWSCQHPDLGCPIGSPLRGHTASVASVAYAPDGKMIISGAFDGTIRLWTNHGRPMGSTMSYRSSVCSMAISPSSQHVLASYNDGSIRLWQISPHDMRRVFRCTPPSDANVRSVAFSPDGEAILLGSDDMTVHLSDVPTRRQKIMPPFVGHTDSVLSVAFSSDGAQIASGSMDNTVRIWDVPGAKSRRLPDEKRETKFAVFSPDGKAVVSALADQTILLWDLQASPPIPHQLQGQISGDLNCVAFASDGSRIAAASYDGRQAFLYLWVASTRRLITSLNSLPCVNSLFFAPDKDAFCVTFETSFKNSCSATWNRLTRDGEVVFDDIPAKESSADEYTVTATALDDMCFFRPKKPGGSNGGLWVFFKDCVIKARDDGSAVTIIPHPRERLHPAVRAFLR